VVVTRDAVYRSSLQWIHSTVYLLYAAVSAAPNSTVLEVSRGVGKGQFDGLMKVVQYRLYSLIGLFAGLSSLSATGGAGGNSSDSSGSDRIQEAIQVAVSYC
jgi:hypothetical protein